MRRLVNLALLLALGGIMFDCKVAPKQMATADSVGLDNALLGISIKEVPEGVPAFKREYSSTVESRPKTFIVVKITAKSYYYSFGGDRTDYSGELTQSDGKWILFDPEKPADKILDPVLLPKVQDVCQRAMLTDKVYREGSPSAYTDEKGQLWRRAEQ